MGRWPSPAIGQGSEDRVSEHGKRPCGDQESPRGEVCHPDLANNYVGHLITFEFQVNSEQFFSVSTCHTVYMQFKFD